MKIHLKALPRRRAAALLTTFATAALACSLLPGTAEASNVAQAGKPSRFGFMLPGLTGFTSPSVQQFADLAQTQLDPNISAPLPGNADNPALPSGFTYLGQFIDHDLTKDLLPQPSTPVDPTTLVSGRNFRFDLDSVYGGGPDRSPQLYEADRLHFKVQNPNPNGVRDLPRNPDGSAILVEGRNDENEIISQIHTAFLLFHNKLIDRGYDFGYAQRTTINYYRWIVLRDFLPHIVGQDVIDGLRNGTIPRLYNPGSDKSPMTPVEFSVAAYRFGHSQVRLAYVINDEKVGATGTAQNKIQVFNATNTGPDGQGDLRGGRQLPATRQIDWGNFFPAVEEADADPTEANISRKIDILISRSLFNLPIPGAEASGSNVLGFRNMVRAKFYNMASGQAVATAMGLTPIPASQITTPGAFGGAFDAETPLWYYILAESKIAYDGEKLGPVGARIVGDVFLRVLDLVNDKGFTPRPPLAPATGQFTMADFLVEAGVATRP